MKPVRAPLSVRIRCKYTLGDIVVLTAAVRDLHRAYPGVFRTSIETSAPEVWKYNPYVSPSGFRERIVEVNDVQLDRSGSSGRHYAHAYLDLINKQLRTTAQLSAVKGDIHLSREERSWHSDVWSLCGSEVPFWLISCGGKFDIPIKWWDHRRYQEVVDAFQGKIQFVQVGWWGNHHPRLDGVIDLRGKTRVRDLIHLTYYAQGVLCGVTSLMHLAAAVPTEHGGDRAAVIIGGAREPSSWEAYPHHEYISTERNVGCAYCWKSHLSGRRDACESLLNEIPECMDLITAEEVISRLERLEKNGQITFLRLGERRAASKAIQKAALENSFDRDNINELNAPAQARAYLPTIPPYPRERFNGRGIVICAGGARYFPLAWVCIRMLRMLGCTLPIELWHYGPNEIDKRMAALVRPFGVRCVDANEMKEQFPMRNPLGWELKSYALLHSSFREVLSLDADNVPIRNPEYLFDASEYQEKGAVFWPDYGQLSSRRAIWKHCEVAYRKEAEFESGQMLVNKEACWREVNLAWWYNDHSEFFYQHIWGDKDTFHLAWRRLDRPYAMIPHPIVSLEGTMCQHDFQGERVFQHRNTPKFVLFGPNPRLSGFLFEAECLAFLTELQNRWNGRINGEPDFEERNGWRFRRQSCDAAVFSSIVDQNEYLLPDEFEKDDAIIDVGAHIGSFSFACHLRGSRRIIGFEPHPSNYRLARLNTAKLEGVSLRRTAVLDRHASVHSEDFPNHFGFSNTGGCRVQLDSSGGSTAVPINDLLRDLKHVRLLKLDCEGSEWPILLKGAEWIRVEAVCGEYHLFSDFVRKTFGISKKLDPQLLFDTLAGYFPNVLIEAPNHEGLGRFWASRKKRCFASAGRRINIFKKRGS